MKNDEALSALSLAGKLYPKEDTMKGINSYKEDTMKGINRYAAISLRGFLAATVVMFGVIRSNDYVSRAAPAAFAAEQPAQGALRWRQTSGPEGAAVVSLLSDGPNLFAGTSAGGVFRSANQGESWTAINTGLIGARIDSLAAVGTNIFAGTAGGGVFRLNNQEERWVAVNAGLTDPGITALAVSGTYIVAATGGGVFRSLDQGESWFPVNTGLPPNVIITSLAAVGTNIFAGLTGLFRAASFDRTTRERAGLPSIRAFPMQGLMKSPPLGRTSLPCCQTAGSFDRAARERNGRWSIQGCH